MKKIFILIFTVISFSCFSQAGYDGDSIKHIQDYMVSDTVKNILNAVVDFVNDSAAKHSDISDSIANIESFNRDSIYQYEQDSSIARLSDISDSLNAYLPDTIIGTIDTSQIEALNTFIPNHETDPVYVNDSAQIKNDILALQGLTFESAARTIYVETTGNDETGDGTSVGTAFATLGRALEDMNDAINANITIQFGSGTFDMTQEDVIQFERFKGLNDIIMKGEMVQVETGLSLTQNSTDPTLYDASGSPGWITDEFQHMFLQSGSNYYPITNNTSDQLGSVISGLASVTEVWNTATTINSTNTANYKFICNTDVTFDQLHFYNIGNVEYQIGGDFTVNDCKYTASAQNKKVIYGYEGDPVFRRVSFAVGFNNYSIDLLVFRENYIDCIATAFSTYAPAASIKDLVLEGTTTGILAQGGVQISGATTGMKFLNCPTAFLPTVLGEFSIDESANIILSGVTNLIRLFSYDYKAKLVIDYDKIIGSPTNWFYGTAPSFYINNDIGYYVYVKGVHYPEIQYELSETLTNNTIDSVVVGDLTQNKSIKIKYTIERGSGFRTGSIDILADGTNVYNSTDTFIDNGDGEVDAASIVISSDLNGNEILMTLTLDAGSDAVLQYNVERTMINL